MELSSPALAAFAIIWFLTRRLQSSFERFVCLFSVWMCAIPLGYFWFHASPSSAIQPLSA